MKSPFLACLALVTATSMTMLDAPPAEACGGCFVQPTERTVVTDHRMALSVSTTQTVLWDQIRYSGDPAEFAWVLPVRAGAKLQLSNDAFFTALDASSQPVVYAPQTFGGNYGCGLTGCSTTTADSASAANGAGSVQILSQEVVGPYETVTLRATDPGALRTWLKSHAFAIPVAVGPTIDAYVAESFDFIALRLRPDCGERSMQPVRIVTQGADPTLPLRMVAAGVGAKVGLTLYVISEGRWQPQNFPHAVLDERLLLWDRTQNRSNYEPLTQALMAEESGRTWVTEYADKPQLFTLSDPRYAGGRAPGYATTGRGGVTPGLADTYYSQCRSRTARPTGSPSPAPSAQPFTPCRNSPDAGVISGDDAGQLDGGAHDDAGDGGAGEDAGGEHDAGAGEDAGDDAGLEADAADASDAGDASAEATAPDAGAGGAGGEDDDAPTSQRRECLYLDDIDVALTGLHARDVWITRLRASLPADALGAGDLRLEAAPDQSLVSNVHYTTVYADEDSAGAGSRDSCVSAPKRHTAFGSWAVAAATAIAGLALLRRRTRR